MKLNLSRMLRYVASHLPVRAIRAGSLGLADQVVISATNFAVIVVAARTLGPAEFGQYSLLQMVLMLVMSFQGALVTVPLTVFGATKDGLEYRRYASSVGAFQAILSVATGAIAVLSGIAVSQFSPALGSMTIAMGAAATSWQIHDYTRRVLYTESRIGAALINDVITSGARLALTAALLVRVGLTGERLFLLLAGTWLLGALFGLWQIRHSLINSIDRGVAIEHWRFGRWLIVSEVVDHLPRYVTAVVMTSLFSVSAYGAYRAIGQFAQGFYVPLQALASVLRPKLARDSLDGPHAIWRTILPIMVGGCAVFLIVIVGILLVRVQLFGALFGEEYLPYIAVIVLPLLAPVLFFPGLVLGTAIQAVRRTRTLLVGSVIGAVTGTVLGVVLLVLFGLPAAGSVTIIGAVASGTWIGWSWKRVMDGHVGHVSSKAVPNGVSST